MSTKKIKWTYSLFTFTTCFIMCSSSPGLHWKFESGCFCVTHLDTVYIMRTNAHNNLLTHRDFVECYRYNT